MAPFNPENLLLHSTVTNETKKINPKTSSYIYIYLWFIAEDAGSPPLLHSTSIACSVFAILSSATRHHQLWAVDRQDCLFQSVWVEWQVWSVMIRAPLFGAHCDCDPLHAFVFILKLRPLSFSQGARWSFLVVSHCASTETMSGFFLPVLFTSMFIRQQCCPSPGVVSCSLTAITRQSPINLKASGREWIMGRTCKDSLVQVRNSTGQLGDN